MAKHTIRIEYLEKQGNIDNIDFSVEPNNVSSKALNDLTNVNAYNDLFLLNLSDLSGKYKYSGSGNVRYYISSTISDENSNIDITLSISTTNARGISLIFSKDVYPTTILVNGVSINNENERMEILVPYTYPTTTTIKFIKMNKPNIPLIITNINTGVSMDYTDDEIKYIRRVSELATDDTMPKYELVSQYGSCSFIDKENVVLKLKAQGVLKKPKSVKFFLDDALIGVYKVTDWEYETTNSIVKIELGDTLNNLKDILIEEKQEEYKPIEYSNVSGYTYYYTTYDLFLEIKSMVENQGEVFEELSPSVVNWLKSNVMNVVKYSSRNLNDLIIEFCNLTQLTFYKTQDGKVGVYLWR